MQDGGPRGRGSPETDVCRTKKLSKQNFLERLPSEILLKILSYLDAQSLFCISHVSRLFHRLSNEDFLWQNIFTSEFGRHTWEPKSADGAELKEEKVERMGHLASRWKMLFFKMKAGQDMNKWRKKLRDTSPYTGLPSQTKSVLGNLNVSWELTLRSHFGPSCTLHQSQAFFFRTSVVISWSETFHHFNNICSIQVYGVRKNPRNRQPSWRSLILKLDIEPRQCRFFSIDRRVKVFLLQPNVVIGVWRGDNRVAFIMVSLHFHKLVEKSLLGSPTIPYTDPVEPPIVGDSDPELGLHYYTLHFVLHNTGTEIMSGHFCQLSCHRDWIKHGFVELKVIKKNDLSQHRSLSGSIGLSWKRDELEDTVENCCFMTLTLLDVFGKPFWCISSPVNILMKKDVQSCNYSGDHFVMEYQNPDGEVKMQLVWLEEQKQFFLFSLTVYVSVDKVNKRFGRHY